MTRNLLHYITKFLYAYLVNTLSKEVTLSEILSALSDPTRLLILRELRERHERCEHMEDYLGVHVTDLTEAAGLSQPAVSKHLSVLRHAGLVRVQKRGQWSYYTRDEAALENAKRLVQEV